MNVVGFCALHYGEDYLKYVIRSIIDHVDEIHIAYSAIGSHGSRTLLPCPDTREQLYAIAAQAAGSKLRWHDGEWNFEGQQRDSIHEYAPDADVILVIDSDEVWEDGFAEEIIAYAQTVDAQRIRLPFWHLWRSFHRGFMHDPAFPERVICPKHSGDTITMPTDHHVWHGGYAQRSALVRYKLETHGHKAEFRRDVDWFNDVFMANRQYDCHVVGSQYWDCEAMDMSRLPSVLKHHPYRHMGVIP